ncbi:hypothetical protein ACLKA7_009579 [Drosophila subpalustris]
MPTDQVARFHARKCDVSDEQQVIDTFNWIDQTLGGADVLVNNAGIMRYTTLIGEGNSADLRATLDTNVLGVTWCTREAFRCTKIKITSVSPGAVDTEIFDTALFPNDDVFPMLRSEDVADAISYCIQTPPNV